MLHCLFTILYFSFSRDREIQSGKNKNSFSIKANCLFSCEMPFNFNITNGKEWTCLGSYEVIHMCAYAHMLMRCCEISYFLYRQSDVNDLRFLVVSTERWIGTDNLQFWIKYMALFTYVQPLVDFSFILQFFRSFSWNIRSKESVTFFLTKDQYKNI